MNSRLKWLFGIGLLVFTLGSLTACGETVKPTKTGDVMVKWAVSPYGCKSGDVDKIEVVLEKEAPIRRKTAPCEGGPIVFKTVPFGRYSAEFTGFNEQGEAIFSGRLKELSVDDEGINKPEPVELTAKRASIVVEWRFENGEVCGFNGIETIEVTGFTENYNEEFKETFSCQSGRGRIESLVADKYVIRLRGETPKGKTFQSSKEVVLKRGQKHSIKLSLEKQ